MRRNSYEVALLLADITGSTPLYEAVGDETASSQINQCLGCLRSISNREGGTFIRSKGDDLLCTFSNSASALKAARLMLSRYLTGPLTIHAGIHFGRIIWTGEDVFGDAVNLTARLAAIARPGEVLASRSFLGTLSEAERGSFRVLDSIIFKGKNEPTEVYSLLEDVVARTEAWDPGPELQPGIQEMAVVLRYKTHAWQCKDRGIISIGRSQDCDLIIGQPWISRRHAIVMVKRGKIQIDDQSSAGTYVTVHDGRELLIRRETAFLTGSGIISPTVRPTDAGAEIIHYETSYTRRDQEVGT